MKIVWRISVSSLMPTYKEQQILDKVCKVTRQKQIKYYDFIPFFDFQYEKIIFNCQPSHFSPCSAVPAGHKRSYDSDSDSVASENQTAFSVMDNSSFVPIHMVSFVVRCTACSLKHSLWIINAFGVWRISLRWTTWNVLSEKRIAILSLINTYGENKFTP